LAQVVARRSVWSRCLPRGGGILIHATARHDGGHRLLSVERWQDAAIQACCGPRRKASERWWCTLRSALVTCSALLAIEAGGSNVGCKIVLAEGVYKLRQSLFVEEGLGIAIEGVTRLPQAAISMGVDGAMQRYSPPPPAERRYGNTGMGDEEMRDKGARKIATSLDCSKQCRHLVVAAGSEVSIYNVRLVGGRHHVAGGSILLYGGLYLYNVALLHNRAPNGGAIYCEAGVLTAQRITCRHNYAYSGCGGVLYFASRGQGKTNFDTSIFDKNGDQCGRRHIVGGAAPPGTRLLGQSSGAALGYTGGGGQGRALSAPGTGGAGAGSREVYDVSGVIYEGRPVKRTRKKPLIPPRARLEGNYGLPPSPPPPPSHSRPLPISPPPRRHHKRDEL